jgi:hypothetical protein
MEENMRNSNTTQVEGTRVTPINPGASAENCAPLDLMEGEDLGPFETERFDGTCIMSEGPPAGDAASRQNGDILLAAHAVINKGRQGTYGPPNNPFARTAALWTAYLNNYVAPKDVAVCLALLKLSRESFKHKTDNLLDAAGYIGLAQDLAERDADRAAASVLLW